MTFSEIRYYYYRDQHRAPRVTLCRVRDDLGRYGYGWSICTDPSPHPGDRIHDGQRIRGGRSIARGRAEAALSVRRGLACPIGVDGVICRLYWRPICREEALMVIHDCQAHGLLSFLESRNVRLVPMSLQPSTRLPIGDIPRLGSQIPYEKLANAIRAGADANELARLEMLGAVDAAGYLGTPTVYSEALKRFVPESEAL